MPTWIIVAIVAALSLQFLQILVTLIGIIVAQRNAEAAEDLSLKRNRLTESLLKEKESAFGLLQSGAGRDLLRARIAERLARAAEKDAGL